MKKLSVLVNARLLLNNRLEGLGVFKYEILKRLCIKHPEIDFHFIFDRSFDAGFVFSSNVFPHVINPPTRHPFLWWWWLEYSLPRVAKKLKCDVFLSLDGMGSMHLKIPQVLVIHDLNFIHRPFDLPVLVRKFYSRNFRLYANKACKLFTVSEFSRQDLAFQYQLDMKNIGLSYNALPSLFFEDGELERWNLIYKKKQESEPYFVYVGAIHPRKNLETLLEAFHIFKNTHPGSYQLAIAGKCVRFYKDEWNALVNSHPNKNDILVLGRISEPQKHALLSNSLALVYPSFFEGFGIPILEAWAAQTAVLTSNRTALPEVAGNAAVCIDPNEPQQWAAEMKNMVLKPEWRNSLIEKGKNRLTYFSWDKSARNIWDGLIECTKTQA